MAGHGRNEQVIRNLPSHGKRVAIYIDNRRWRCQDCGKTVMEVLPAVNSKREMTERLVRWIGQQSLKRTFANLAEETGLALKKKQRPKFERKGGDFGYGAPPERVMYDQLFTMSRMTFETPNQHGAQETEINFGADISTLVRLIEEGRL